MTSETPQRFDLDGNQKLDLDEFSGMIQRHRWRKEGLSGQQGKEPFFC
jgi:hypothetical protein